jgi:hypothetical protein
MAIQARGKKNQTLGGGRGQGLKRTQQIELKIGIFFFSVSGYRHSGGSLFFFLFSVLGFPFFLAGNNSEKVLGEEDVPKLERIPARVF